MTSFNSFTCLLDYFTFLYVFDNVCLQIFNKVFNSFLNNVFDNVSDIVLDNVLDNVFDNVFDDVIDKVFDKFFNNIFDSISTSSSITSSITSSNPSRVHLHQNPYPHILFLPPLLPTTGDSSFFQVSDEIFRYSRPALTLRAGKASFILYNILRSIGFGNKN